MKIKSLKFKNFRSYQHDTTVNFDNLTALVGKNDIGKSTILEALDIFFNDGKGAVKIDKLDKNVFSDDDMIVIGVEFIDIPESIIVDTAVETNLRDEYLLNAEGNLEILKYYKNGSMKKTVIIANFPNEDNIANIHSKTITELKIMADELGVTVEDRRKSSILRKAIISYYNPTDFICSEIDITKEGGKQIWNSLSAYLPLYMLFQSDRKNEDNDSEIQEPMKLAISEVLKGAELSQKLDEVYEQVVNATTELTQLTLEKLAEMNPEIAQELMPNFKKPSWEKVFNCGLESDSNIPLNKRGSGVRRLVLLNFFRAEAERRKNERGVPNIIYAFEEPETSQHPKHQKMLIDSFIELSNHEINQIIFTTHSPEIAKMISKESLRFLEKQDEDIVVNGPTDMILEKIADSLGILPTIELENLDTVKVAICVEGKNDIVFLNNINNLISEFREICDISSNQCIILPMGGSTLQFWINNKYLSKLKLAQVHIYDSDIGSSNQNKYSEYIEQINQMENGTAFETNLREMENYITPSVLSLYWNENVDENMIAQWDTLDVPSAVAKFTHAASESNTAWEELTTNKKKKKISRAKNTINSEYSLRLTVEMLREFNCYEEIESWFTAISRYI